MPQFIVAEGAVVAKIGSSVRSRETDLGTAFIIGSSVECGEIEAERVSSIVSRQFKVAMAHLTEVALKRSSGLTEPQAVLRSRGIQSALSSELRGRRSSRRRSRRWLARLGFRR